MYWEPEKYSLKLLKIMSSSVQNFKRDELLLYKGIRL